MDVAVAPRPTIAQVILGLFISWQLLFMPAANYLAFFPHGQAEEGELSDSRRAPDQTGGATAVQKAINFAASITDAWTFLTGQVQAWWLFAPDVPKAATFPVVELRWDDDAESAQSVASFLAPLAAVDGVECATLWCGFPPAQSIPPVRLRTILEPNDPQSYFRPLSSFDRLFHYEVRLGLVLVNWNEQALAENPEAWRAAFQQRVRRQWRSIRAYLRWYVQHFQHQHPELPSPQQAILWMRIYQSPEPGQPTVHWRGPVEQPLARWWPDSSPGHDELPIEAFDPVARRFIALKMKE